MAIPRYLKETYWWAYVHPRAIRLFERQWLVNVILWGNFARLRDAALNALGTELPGSTLQIACVYGDLTEHLLGRLSPDADLQVVDVLTIQLANLARKLAPRHSARLVHANSEALPQRDASQDRALLFFLLHEQPAAVRRATLAEALRVVKPGGRVVIVDYHGPSPLHPLYWPMTGLLRMLEPFALDLWRADIAMWLPEHPKPARLRKRTLFGGLYQLVTIDV